MEKKKKKNNLYDQCTPKNPKILWFLKNVALEWAHINI